MCSVETALAALREQAERSKGVTTVEVGIRREQITASMRQAIGGRAMSNTLLPCPFCGEESLLRDRYINGVANTKHYIRECRHCKATFAHWFRSVKKQMPHGTAAPSPRLQETLLTDTILSMSFTITGRYCSA